MPSKKRKTTFEKIADNLRRRCDIVVQDLRDYYELFICYHEYLVYIPVIYMERASQLNVKAYYKYVMEHDVFKHMDNLIAVFVARTPRYRPAYRRVMDYFRDKAHILPALDKATMYMYREIARELGLAPATVRDAWSYIRRYAVWRPL